ncbi:MAG: 3-carboxy-cis,cis-muconate cycloisomerase, partial [Cryptosporangiaceae bacterium]|nr:3-carboxy-cis,cis-muconate cycloisomerase [Cryptosporangiaceae bacterium]
VPDFAAPHVHRGATSQDILDTAASLVARRALEPIREDLTAAATTCADLAEAHRGTLMVARTLLQQALPTTFGLVSARWLTALGEATDGLDRATDRLAVQLGGAAGTLAAHGTAGPAVARLMAAELGLAEPALPWHTDRTRFAELAAAAGIAAGTLGTIARDVVLLAQTEVGEAREGSSGGSSAMPHKQNPVRAVLVSAAAQRIPGLVATALAAMVQEHERAAGAWHAEWETYTSLLHLLGGAAERGRDLLAGLTIDPDRMRENLGRTGGMILAEPVAAALAGALGRTAAHDLVAEICAHAAGLPLRDALLADPRVTGHLSEDRIDAALDPANYLGATGELVDRALADHRKRVLR